MKIEDAKVGMKIRVMGHNDVTGTITAVGGASILYCSDEYEQELGNNLVGWEPIPEDKYVVMYLSESGHWNVIHVSNEGVPLEYVEELVKSPAWKNDKTQIVKLEN